MDQRLLAYQLSNSCSPPRFITQVALVGNGFELILSQIVYLLAEASVRLPVVMLTDLSAI